MSTSPHGGQLVARVAKGRRRQALAEEASALPKLTIRDDVATDAQNIAHGVYSPLEGFMVREDYTSVLRNMRLGSDLPWTLPVILDVSDEASHDVPEGQEVCLVAQDGTPVCTMTVEERYRYNKRDLASRVFKTTDLNHPGVARTYAQGNTLLGGKITLLNGTRNPFDRYTLTPAETRVLFAARKWRTIVGFQTRNAPHIGHEYLQKTALSFADGVFINPVIGPKKSGDFRDEVILAAYDALIRDYYPHESAVLSVFRFHMRYAGPREAVFHAIVRKNFGCSHIVIGRDHAGVGNYYKPYEAQEIFREFPDLGMTPLFFREFYFCRTCRNVVNERICPHPETNHVKFSGTQLRELLLRGERPPAEYMRPEVVAVIRTWENPFV